MPSPLPNHPPLGDAVCRPLFGAGLRRIAMLLVGVAVAALAGPGTALAQEGPKWWEQLPGFSTPGGSSQGAVKTTAKAVSQPLNDLRANPVPMRSELMIDALERAIARYQQIVTRGGWPKIPSTRLMRPGDDDERVTVLRQRLAVTGEYKRQGGGSFTFDGELEEAVRRYQERNGLRVSGRADGPTIASLNVPATIRLHQLKQNLQRLRELMAQRVEDRYILVNVAAFQLEAVEKHQVEQRHRVIVGKTERQSPVVRATIKALNFFPFWRVPDSVATLDLIPRLRKEPEYLAKERIRVLTGSFVGPEIDPANIDWNTADANRIKFRQDPGDQNALGLVRIDMPNEHGVYMHDTPMKKLFDSRARAFSAGCVRVQDVFQLALWIGRDEQGFDRQKMEDVLAAKTAFDVNLTRPIPVYFTYLTAWAEPDGAIEFRHDLYGRDGNPELSVAARERDPNEPPPPTQTLAP